MNDWYRSIVSSPDDMDVVGDMLAFYVKEYEDLKALMEPKGRLEVYAQKLPGIMSACYGRWAELSKIVDFLKVQERKVHVAAIRRIHATYNKTMSDRDADKFASVESEVIAQKLVTLEVEEVKSKYEGLSKSIEQMHFQIRNIVELRKAGIEDGQFGFDG